MVFTARIKGYKMKKVSDITFQNRITRVKETVPLFVKGKVTTVSINKQLDKLQDKHKGCLLYNYTPIVTDTIIPAYCKVEKKEVTAHEVYGGFGDPIKDEKGHTVLTDNMGDCECGKGKMWLTKSKRVRAELVIETYKCFSCGQTYDEP